MTTDEYVESNCASCGTTLVQLDGDWVCPECSDTEDFQLVPDEERFSL